MTQIIEKKYFSSTDLKKNTKNVLDTTNDLWEVFIMNNNKPKAVIISVERYNQMNKYFIPEVEPDKWEKESIAQYEKEKNEWTLEFIEWDEVFSFLNNLK